MSNVIIELSDDEIEAAYAWHGGQSSMLYAAASTGSLALGTQRPREYSGDPWIPSRPLTDLEWKRSLVERLESEASCDADDARERIASGDDDGEPDELEDQALALESIARKCRAWLDANPEQV